MLWDRPLVSSERRLKQDHGFGTTAYTDSAEGIIGILFLSANSTPPQHGLRNSANPVGPSPGRSNSDSSFSMHRKNESLFSQKRRQDPEGGLCEARQNFPHEHGGGHCRRPRN